MDPSKNKAILTKAFETDEMRDSLYQVTFRGEKEGETEREKEREWERDRERKREMRRPKYAVNFNNEIGIIKIF